MNKFTLLAAVAALSATPAFAGFNADVHGGISGTSVGTYSSGSQATYGAGLGYDFDLSKQVFAGVQLGIDNENFGKGNGTYVNYSAVARLGYRVAPHDSIYALGGYDHQEYSSSGVDGWRLGAGYEHGFGKMLFAKIEYRHSEGTKSGTKGTQDDGIVGIGVHF